MSGFAKKPALHSVPLAFEDVSVPEWGGMFRVQELGALERDAWEESCIKTDASGGGRKPNLANIRARLVAKCIVDPETGNRMFSDAEAADLGKQPARIIIRLFDIAQKLNAMTGEDVKELQGKSEAAQSAPSTSSSAES